MANTEKFMNQMVDMARHGELTNRDVVRRITYVTNRNESQQSADTYRIFNKIVYKMAWASTASAEEVVAKKEMETYIKAYVEWLRRVLDKEDFDLMWDAWALRLPRAQVAKKHNMSNNGSVTNRLNQIRAKVLELSDGFWKDVRGLYDPGTNTYRQPVTSRN